MEELTQFLDSGEFATPLYFWIACLLILLLIFFPWARNMRSVSIDLQYWKQSVAFQTKRLWVMSIPVVIISILMAGVLSAPEVTTGAITYIYGKPVMLLVDVSGSMKAATELQPELSGRELTVKTFNDLISRREDISFGLLIFSTDNYIARYFTYKNELFQGTLDNTKEIDRIALGTRLAEALEKARLFFAENFEGEDKAIVVVSDFNIAPQLIAETIEEMDRDLLAGINLYLVTVEGEGHEIFTVPQLSELKIVDVNDALGIDQMYEDLSAMRSSLLREEQGLLKDDLIPFLILPALGLISLCLVLSETRFRKIP